MMQNIARWSGLLQHLEWSSSQNSATALTSLKLKTHDVNK